VSKETSAPAKRRSRTTKEEREAKRWRWARDRHRPVKCWKCGEKRKAVPRRKRPAQAFRRICGSCRRFRALLVRQRRQRGRLAFVPRRMQAREERAPLQPAPKEAGVLSPSELAVLEAWRAERRKERERPPPAPLEDLDEPPDMEPVSEEAYRVDPYKDPFRDYTYFLQHQKELEARAQAGAPAREEAAQGPETRSTPERAEKSGSPPRPAKKGGDPPPGPRITRL
jgi:hypothetical protein